MASFKTFFHTSLLTCTALSLAACQTTSSPMDSIRNSFNTMFPSFSQKADDACPPIMIVEDLSFVHQFAAGTAQREENRVSSLFMKDVQSSCKKQDDKVVMTLAIEFDGALGPKSQPQPGGTQYSYPYFLALTTAEGDILSKEVFALAPTYKDGQVTLKAKESLIQIIPQDNDVYSRTKEVLLGFQLTDAELVYNRAYLNATNATKGEAQPVDSRLQALAVPGYATGISPVESSAIPTDLAPPPGTASAALKPVPEPDAAAKPTAKKAVVTPPPVPGKKPAVPASTSPTADTTATDTTTEDTIAAPESSDTVVAPTDVETSAPATAPTTTPVPAQDAAPELSVTTPDSATLEDEEPAAIPPMPTEPLTAPPLPSADTTVPEASTLDDLFKSAIPADDTEKDAAQDAPENSELEDTTNGDDIFPPEPW